MVARIGHINVAKAVHGHTSGVRELAIATPFAAPLGEKVPAGIKFLDAVISCIGNVDVAKAVHGQAGRERELTITIAIAAPLREEISSDRKVFSFRCKFLDAVVACISDIEVPSAIYNDVAWERELAIAAAFTSKLFEENAVPRRHIKPLEAVISSVRNK